MIGLLLKESVVGFETNVEDGVRLVLPSVETTDSYVDLTYRATNDSGLPAYVANGLFHRRGAVGFEVDFNLAYVEVGDGQVLRIRKQVLSVPEGLRVEAPEVPYFTRLESGSDLAERIRLEFPIEPRDPYRRQKQVGTPRAVERLSFTLGYVLEDESLDAREMTLSDESRYWWMSYSDVIRRQRLKECGPIGVRVEVAVPDGR